MTDEVKGALVAGTDPLMERSLGWILGTVPKRILTLVTKLLSMKGIGFGVASYLLWHGKIESWVWLSTVVVLIFGEKALTVIKGLKG